MNREWARQYMQDPCMRGYPHDLLRDAKPCPFCGSYKLSFAQRLNYVHCDKCQTDGPYITGRSSITEDVERLAVAAWNRRGA